MHSRIWNHIIPLLGSYPLCDIDAAALRIFKGQPLSRVEGSTAEVIWIHLTTIFNAAVDDKRLLKSPCKQFRTVKAPRRSRKKARAWRRSTVGAVRAGLQERYHFAVELGLGAGLRQGEAFGAAFAELGSARPRALPAVPLCSVHAPVAQPGTPETALEARQRKPVTVNLVLTTSQGNQIRYNTWNERSWRPALASAGLIKVVGEKVRPSGKRMRRRPVFEVSREDMFHVLRHTFASVQLEAGESIVSLAEWLGHASPKITLDHYAHFMPEAGKRGLAAGDTWLVAPEQDRNVPEKSWPLFRSPHCP